MEYKGVLRKMETHFNSPIEYHLNLGEDKIYVNDLIGKEIKIVFSHYECLGCGKNKKIYRQGHCYDCFFNSPEVGEWIIRPELSKAHLGVEDRDLEYEKKVQLQPHVVYLALSSNVKVGVTRKTQVPTRWIDQGAVAAIPIVEVPNRYLAGITEVKLKEHFADKTNWRKMLKNDVPEADLLEIRESVRNLIPYEVKEFFDSSSSDLFELKYPVVKYPEKVKSINLAKSPMFSYKLEGIKGQYLIFEDGYVFNVRNNEGNVVSLILNQS